VEKNLLCTDMSLLGIVLFGGHLVDDAWLKKSRMLFAEKKVLEPLWQVEGAALEKSVELCIDHESFFRVGSVPEEVRAMVEAKPDRLLQQEVRDASGRTVLQNEERSLWVWRSERSELRRKESWLVCGDQNAVDEFEEKKTKSEDKIKALEKEIAKLHEELKKRKPPVARKNMEATLGDREKELKAKQDRQKARKGIPITVRKFLEEVVLPSAHLCAPTP
jgi:hypothetical protein